MQFALITEAFPPSERGRALGINATIVSTGIISGPILGGLIIDAVDWRWIFYVNLPSGILGILAALRYIPHTKPGKAEPFDFRGAALFFLALLTLLLGLTTGQERGFGDSWVVSLYGITALALAGFVATEMRWNTRCSSSEYSAHETSRSASSLGSQHSPRWQASASSCPST